MSMYGLPDFTVGGALRQTFDIVRHHAGTLLGLTIVLYALPMAAIGLATTLGVAPNADAFRAAAAAHRPMPDLTLFISFAAVTFLIQIGGTILVVAAAVRVSYQGLYGRPASFGDGAGTSLRLLPANFVVIVVSTLGIMLGSLLFVVPGVMLACRWTAAVPALVVERTGVLGSLGRSRDLTRNHRWSILGFLLVIALINGGIFAVVGLGGGALARTVGGVAGSAVGALVGLLVNTFVAALNGASVTAMYFELRRVGDGVLSAETVEAFA